MDNAFASRLAGYRERPILSADKPVSDEVLSRTHARPKQQASIKRLADIFSKTDIGSDPIAQVGALDMQQGDIGYEPRRSQAAGTTYTENYLPSEFAALGPFEESMIARAGMNIANLKNKIIIGPEAYSGEYTGTIPHELGHRGQNILRQYTKDPFSSPYISPMRIPGASLDEPTMRALSIMRGEDVERNLRFMNDRYPRLDEQPWTEENIKNSSYRQRIADLQDAATYYLHYRGLK